jgi:transposase
MRRTREILRLRWGLGQSARSVANSLGISPTTVAEIVRRAHRAGLGWPLPGDLDDAALEATLYAEAQPKPTRPLPDFEKVFRELKRKGVTLELLWDEYRSDHPDQGYSYSRFCELYGLWRGRLEVTMRQHHKAGDKLFVDWAGPTMPITDAATGEITEASIFVAALGASDFTYAEAFEDETLSSWITGHIHAFEEIGGVAAATVPDNTKTAVTKPCFFDPDLNPTYLELARHYDTTILPTRVASPRDKAKVENAVLQVERWVLAPLRDRPFFSLAELNQAIRERLAWLNDRPLSKLNGTRRSLLEQIDRPALGPLPAKRFEIPQWKTNVGVGIDYHVQFDHHYYSVPYQLVGERVDVRATLTVVECIYRGRRVASHRRSFSKGGFVTDPAHMPDSHRRYAEWTPSRMIGWAETIGPHTAAAARHILARLRHPEQGFRSCLGIISLGKKYGNDRLEAACRRARAIGSIRYKTIQSILRTGLDGQPLPSSQSTQPSLGLEHDNVRGPDYYQ